MNHDLVVIEDVPMPEIPEKWDFKVADKDFDKHIKGWRRLSIEVLEQLWVFYQKLAFRTGGVDKSANTELPTWTDWLEAKGIGSDTPIRHFKRLGWMPDTKPHVALNSGENEWYTPKPYIDAAKAAMGRIDTDPASSTMAQGTVEAETYYTKEDDGLDKQWAGNVWMNPPYEQPLVKNFCDKFIEKYESHEISQGCVLVNNATETAFGQKMLSSCNAVCFPSGRIKFIDKEGAPSGAPLQGQMVLYFGDNISNFIDSFCQFGVVFRK